jgi:hypothetical protein
VNLRANSQNCGEFIPRIVEVLFPELWRIYSQNCGKFIPRIVEDLFPELWTNFSLLFGGIRLVDFVADLYYAYLRSLVLWEGCFC